MTDRQLYKIIEDTDLSIDLFDLSANSLQKLAELGLRYHVPFEEYSQLIKLFELLMEEQAKSAVSEVMTLEDLEGSAKKSGVDVRDLNV